MKKYLPTFLFYLISFIFLFILNMVSPNAHDGGLGLGGLAFILLTVLIFILFVVNIFRGIKKDKHYYIIAAQHLLVFLGLLFNLFL